jgi:hypothetical protein
MSPLPSIVAVGLGGTKGTGDGVGLVLLLFAEDAVVATM